MGRIARRFLLLAGLTLALGQACLSPTLPMPPPEEPQVTAGSEPDTVLVSGRVPYAYSMVWAVNWSQAELDDPRAVGGDQSDDEGAYAFELRGREGEFCEIWYEYHGDKSQIRQFEIPPLP